MLPRPTVPASLAELLAVFRPHLTAPSYRAFCALACGLIVAGRRRTVTGMLTGAGLARVWHHGRAYHLFAYARWCPDRLGLALLHLIVALLMPAGQPIVLGHRRHAVSPPRSSRARGVLDPRRLGGRPAQDRLWQPVGPLRGAGDPCRSPRGRSPCPWGSGSGAARARPRRC